MTAGLSTSAQDAILNRLDALERTIVGLRDTKALTYQMSKGIIHGPAIKNIGTAKRPRYRFHRTKAVDQFLNRAQ
jgi:hypothetical protein